jgi:hypothetical protein
VVFGKIPQDKLKSYSRRVTNYPRFRLKVTRGRGFLQMPSVCPNSYKYPNGYWFVTIWLILQKPYFSDRSAIAALFPPMLLSKVTNKYPRVA